MLSDWVPAFAGMTKKFSEVPVIPAEAGTQSLYTPDGADSGKKAISR
jgi:hypothetical protein